MTVNQSPSPEQKLASWLNNMVAMGMVAILMRRDSNSGEIPCGSFELSDDDIQRFSAVGYARRVYEVCISDASMQGGAPLYKIIACGVGGIEIASNKIKIETKTNPIDPFSNLSPRDAHIAREFQGVTDAYKSLVATLMNVNAQFGGQLEICHTKLTSQFEVVEKARSEENQRLIDKMKAESDIKRSDESWAAILKVAVMFGPMVAAEKFDIDPKLAKTMMLSMFPMAATAIENNGSEKKEQKKEEGESGETKAGGKLGAIVSKIDALKLREFFCSLSDETLVDVVTAMGNKAPELFALVPPSEHENLKKFMGI